MTDDTVDREERPIRRGRRRRDSDSSRRPNIPRTRPLLDFSNFSIDENNAMLDKMVIRYEHHMFRITPSFTDVIKTPVLRNFLSSLNDEDSIFNNPPRGKVYSLVTKRRDPLFSGSKLSLRATGHSNTFNLIMDIKLNPTRFVAHGPHFSRSSNQFVELTRERRNRNKRLTLDKNDNYIVGNYRTFQNFLQDDPPTGTRTSFLSLMGEVQDWFETQINERSENDLYSIEYNWDDWSISQGEVYYEFFTENAVSTMRRIAYFLPTIYEDTRFRQYRGSAAHPFETQQTHSSFSVHVKLRGKLQLVIYAKTRNNIRFELRNSTTLRTELSHMDLMLRPEEEAELNSIDDPNDRERWKRNYVSTDHEGMAHIMRIAAHHLAILIERIVTVVNEHPEDEQEITIIPRFINFLYESIEDDQLVEAIWSAIAVNGFIELSNFSTVRDNLLQASDFGTYLSRHRNRVFPLPALSALLLSLRQDQNIGLLDEESE